ncbi:MAG: A24 family peptidase, partial [Planctomycetota bacterium]
ANSTTDQPNNPSLTNHKANRQAFTATKAPRESTFDMPPPIVAIPIVWGVGAAVGAVVNWAAYALAWNPRPISPWSPAHPQAPPRILADRLPLVGWWRLRRESPLHGRWFWIRPLCVELSVATALAGLYWWEVIQQGLVQPQLDGIPVRAPEWTTTATFLSHAVLLSLMAAASLIDIDEKIIPDEITVVGTLLGLIIAAASPMSLLPQIAIAGAVKPPACVEIELPADAAVQQRLLVEPVTLAAPNAWPAALGARPHGQGLAIGLGCLAVWYFSLMPRFWRRRRGALYGLRIMFARVLREMRRLPLSAVVLAVAFGTLIVWYQGGAAWVGLLTALVGMIASGSLVWAVRIVGSAALKREAMGFGDVTLMMMIGAFLGWQAGIIIFFVAPFAGLVVGVLQAVLRRDDVIPYGPFLCLATAAVVVSWGSLWRDGPGGMQALFWLWWLIPAVLVLCVVMLGAVLVIWRNIKSVIR